MAADRFDFVIVGAGSAGCVLADRLSADGRSRVLVLGDYVSSVEIPWIHGSLADYRSTLARLRPLAEAAQVVVPGHGPAHTSETALRLIDEDEDYLDALERGEEKPRLPSGRDSHAQRRIHRENREKVGAA